MAANIHGLTIHTWSGIPWKDTGDEGRDKPAEIDQLFIQWDPGGRGKVAFGALWGMGPWGS